jgi:hypothetical protein
LTFGMIGPLNAEATRLVEENGGLYKVSQISGAVAREALLAAVSAGALSGAAASARAAGTLRLFVGQQVLKATMGAAMGTWDSLLNGDDPQKTFLNAFSRAAHGATDLTWGTYGSFAVGSTAALVTWAAGGSNKQIRTALNLGGLFGGIAGNAAYGYANAIKGVPDCPSAWAVSKMAGFETAVTVIGGGIGYAATGTWDGALAGAQIGQTAGHIAIAVSPTLRNALLSACFGPETPLLTPEGSKRIADLKVGDLVLARDENDYRGAVLPKVVEEVFVRTGKLLHLHVGGLIIRTTAEHPFFVAGKEWLSAGELQAGDRLLGPNGEFVAVEEIFDTGEFDTVYNIRVADFHTYFVGSEEWGFSVWAHNAYRVPKDVRDGAVAEAWRQEADLVRRTGQGTRPWTAKQIQELLTTGKVRGYVGHHINSVNDSPLFAGLADNIQFLTFRQHYRIHNNGRYRIPVYGPLISRD